MSKYDLTATTLFGLEDVLADELKNLGAEGIRIKNRAVYFKGDLELIYKANYNCRTALKILKPIHRFKAHNDKSFYNLAKKINWSDYFNVYQTFAIDAVVNSKYFKHSKYVSLVLKDAIVDQFRENVKTRPNVNVSDPDIRIHLHIDDTFCTISMDSSGESLHKRGYRLDKNEAPLNEVLAAGIIKSTQWNFEQTLLDPMCGSGTIAIEAALIANNIPPAYLRKKFTFMNWKDYDEKLWQKVKDDADKNVHDYKFKIKCSDIDYKSVFVTKENIKRAKLTDKIEVKKEDFFKLNKDDDVGIIVTNPPYGLRLENSNLESFYKKIGDKLKKDFTGCDAWIFSANDKALKALGLRTSKRLHFNNGGLDSRFYKYELYMGSKKFSQ